MPKLSSKAADYMELTGAKKDGDCSKVAVKGGVSKERGCCNYYQPRNHQVIAFKCGVCEYLEGADKRTWLYGDPRDV